MSSRAAAILARTIESRSPVIEPLAIIAIVSLLSSWAIQPFVTHALSQQSAVAQGAAQAALWLAGVLSPFAALAKALAAAVVCWSCGIFLGERLSFAKLISVFCLAEVVFTLRDVALLGVLAARGLDSMRTTSDLIVAFGINGFLH